MMPRSTSWKLSIMPVAMPTETEILARGGVHCKGIAYLHDVMDAWMHYVVAHGGEVKQGADYVDWAEQAVRLESGLRLLPDDTVVALRYHETRVIARDGTEISPDVLFDRAQIGDIPLDMPPDAIMEPYANINSYMGLEAVRTRFRREYRLVRADMDMLHTAIDDMLMRHDVIWIKNMKRIKTLMVRIPCDGDFFSSDEWYNIEMECIHYEGDENAWLLQTHADIANETRFFIVDGKPVVGAGCIEPMTPLQNDGNAYDHKTERVRNSGVIEHSCVINDMLPFAEQAAYDIGKEITCPQYVMDVGVINGDFGIIELNSFMNAGLYALDIDGLIEAVRDSAMPPVPMDIHDMEKNQEGF